MLGWIKRLIIGKYQWGVVISRLGEPKYELQDDDGMRAVCTVLPHVDSRYFHDKTSDWEIFLVNNISQDELRVELQHVEYVGGALRPKQELHTFIRETEAKTGYQNMKPGPVFVNAKTKKELPMRSDSMNSLLVGDFAESIRATGNPDNFIDIISSAFSDKYS